MRLALILPFILILSVLSAFAQAPVFLTGPGLEMAVMQGGRNIPPQGAPSDVTTITLKSDAFELHISEQTYGSAEVLRLCISDSSTVLKDVQPGLEYSAIPCMRPGTGIASSFGTIHLHDEAHHYLSNVPNFPDRLSHRPKDQTYAAVFEGVFAEPEDIPLTQWSETLYILAYADLDKDKTIDPDEYRKLILSFE